MAPAELRVLGSPRPLDRALLEDDSASVARRLLGTLLIREEADGGATVLRIIETEAYRETDPASHSFRGPTPRSRVMFGPPGHAYVYLTYGLHHCVNVSCEPAGVGSAVLLRAGLALTNRELIRERRGPGPRERDLLAGPGRLTQALAIDRGHDGADLCVPGAPLWLGTDGYLPGEDTVVSGPRVGIREAADVPWRFWLREVPEVSRYTRHPRAPRPAG